MITRVPINPELLDWAGERAAVPTVRLRKQFPKYDKWKTGDAQPTLRQLQCFARITHTPIGYFFLTKPPKLDVPIPDFRTLGNRSIDEPSPDLLDTIYTCQRRQEWYRDYARSVGESAFDFIGSATIQSSVVATAEDIRSRLNFRIDERINIRTSADAVSLFRRKIDDLGILVMINGVVDSNTHRKLDVEEFRGFALSDTLAPLVFVNGADTKSGQIFTLAHEIAHLWLGETALSNASPNTTDSQQTEQWCNQVAAETLVPLSDLKLSFDPTCDLFEETRRLARHFKVSTLVILRRIFDAGGMSRDHFRHAYKTELSNLKGIIARRLSESKGGGDWYLTAPVRISNRFAKAVITSSLEGRSTFTEAFSLLGCRKMSTFRELGHSLGIDA